MNIHQPPVLETSVDDSVAHRWQLFVEKSCKVYKTKAAVLRAVPAGAKYRELWSELCGVICILLTREKATPEEIAELINCHRIDVPTHIQRVHGDLSGKATAKAGPLLLKMEAITEAVEFAINNPGEPEPVSVVVSSPPPSSQIPDPTTPALQKEPDIPPEVERVFKAVLAKASRIVTRDNMTGRKQSFSEVVCARDVFCIVLVATTQLTHREIGGFLGGRDDVIVDWAIKRMTAPNEARLDLLIAVCEYLGIDVAKVQAWGSRR